MNKEEFFKFVLPMIIFLICPTCRSVSRARNDDFPANVLARVIYAGGGVGGVEQHLGCEEQKRVPLPGAGSKIDDKLTSLQADIPTLTWSKNNSGYRVYVGSNGMPSLTNVTLPPLTLLFSEVSAATDQLLSQPSVEDHIAKTHLKLFSPPIGYRGATPPTSAKIRLDLPAGTLADDLDRIAQAGAKNIWIYTVSECKGSYNARLFWLE
jgi:hypothetical protein